MLTACVRKSLFTAAVLSSAVVIGQISIEPPSRSGEAPRETATQPEAPRPPSATMPTTSEGAGDPTTQPAEKVLERLLHDRPATGTVAPTTTGSPVAQPGIDAAAPNEPKVNRLREGQFLWNRVGRLIKDEKTGEWLFAFDADGQEMRDPPMIVLPSRLLMAMEEATEKGTKQVKFKVSGEITEYRGKNHLLIRFMQTVKDLNQGLGG